MSIGIKVQLTFNGILKLKLLRLHLALYYYLQVNCKCHVMLRRLQFCNETILNFKSQKRADIFPRIFKSIRCLVIRM